MHGAWFFIAALGLQGCARSELSGGDAAKECPESRSIHFERPSQPLDCIETAEARELVFRDAASWEAFWSEHVICSHGGGEPHPTPSFDFERQVLLGVMLESGCAYSGCQSSVALIAALLTDGCTLSVRTRALSPTELGPCDACVQPRDFVLVDEGLLEGIDRIVFAAR